MNEHSSSSSDNSGSERDSRRNRKQNATFNSKRRRPSQEPKQDRQSKELFAGLRNNSTRLQTDHCNEVSHAENAFAAQQDSVSSMNTFPGVGYPISASARHSQSQSNYQGPRGNPREESKEGQQPQQNANSVRPAAATESASYVNHLLQLMKNKPKRLTDNLLSVERY